jgi:GNAT superfamily N-acetyltransferase
MEGLADYHNKVASSFAGSYPMIPTAVHMGYMAEHIENKTALILGVFSKDGSLSGFAMASYEGRFGEVDYLFIKKKLRGERFGRLLLERLLAHLKKSGVDFVDVHVVLGNPAKTFYEKFGFQLRSETLSVKL